MAERKQQSGSMKKTATVDNAALEMGAKPPQAVEIEASVIGAMLLEQSCVDVALEELNADCFYDPKHRMIFEAISSLALESSAVDVLTVTAKLRQKGQLEDVGGLVALDRLTENIASAAHIEFHVRLLKQKAIQRALISASIGILKDSFDESVNVDDLIDKAQTNVYNAIQSNIRKDVQEIGAIINSAMDEISAQQESTGLSGVPSGYVSLDRITNGWQKSDLIILAARPSVGKTAFALNIARNAAVDHNMPVAVFSLEMSSTQLAKRLMTSETGLSADKIKGSVKLEEGEWQQMEQKLARLSKSSLYIDDTPGIQLMEFRTKAKNLVKNKKVRLIVVDYLQLMQGPAELRGMREQEVAAISRTLKATAKELEVPIIALSQLSRQAVQRGGGIGKPQLSDLRESGSIEQDADMVLFIHRPDYVGLSENAEDRDKTQLIIAKHRNGAIADIDMIFKSDQVRFVEADDTLAGIAASQPSLSEPIPSRLNDISGYNPFENGPSEF